MIQIEFINLSTSISQSSAARIVKALQVQIDHDFGPLWGIEASLSLAPLSAKVPSPGLWSIAFLDNADQAGALGYHDLTAEGLPLGKVFVKTTLTDGGLVSVTASHECLEMLADPDINLTAEFDDPQGAPAKFYAYEVCDACEDDSLGYAIKSASNTIVSDFVTPAYFEQFRAIDPTRTRFDFKRHITAPFQIAGGGYMGVLDLANLAQGWQQITVARTPSAKSRANIGSRRERRRTPRDLWLTSTY